MCEMSEKNTSMTPDEFAEKMREIKKCYGHDRENRHWEMDGLLCDMLKSLGYAEGVEIFEDTEKWYA
jgi:hypothetical protein